MDVKLCKYTDSVFVPSSLHPSNYNSVVLLWLSFDVKICWLTGGAQTPEISVRADQQAVKSRRLVAKKMHNARPKRKDEQEESMSSRPQIPLHLTNSRAFHTCGMMDLPRIEVPISNFQRAGGQIGGSYGHQKIHLKGAKETGWVGLIIPHGSSNYRTVQFASETTFLPLRNLRTRVVNDYDRCIWNCLSPIVPSRVFSASLGEYMAGQDGETDSVRASLLTSFRITK